MRRYKQLYKNYVPFKIAMFDHCKFFKVKMQLHLTRFVIMGVPHTLTLPTLTNSHFGWEKAAIYALLTFKLVVRVYIIGTY